MKVREDLPEFLNNMGLTGKGVEIGVLQGQFAWHILKLWRGEKLYCVDAWRHIGDNVDLNNPDHNGQLNNMAHAFMNLYGFDSRAVLIREYSASASKLFKPKELDFVYIDAAHDYDNVMNDLKVWFPKVRLGGVIAGHDYIDSKASENGHSEFGVKRAVDEFAKKKGYTVFVTQEEDFPTWYMIKT